MKPLQNPSEFDDLTAFFLPGADKLYNSVEEIIDDGWQSLTSKQADVAKAFLDEILNGDYSEEQLREIWRASRASISPFRGREGSCRELLEMMRSRYETNIGHFQS